MPRWLLWFLLAFVVVNGLALVANLPTPFLLFTPMPGGASAQSMDGLVHFIGRLVAFGTLLAWGVIAFVMWKVMKPKA